MVAQYDCDVAIVGGGPVGMLLAILLQRRGVTVKVFEQYKEPSDHSRAIGVHPISLQILDTIDLAAPFIQAGVVIREGKAFDTKAQQIGTLSFAECPPPFPFSLALPQTCSETLLRQQLVSLDSEILTMDARAIALNVTKQACQLLVRIQGTDRSVTSRFVVGCDGKHSFVRKNAGIAFNGAHYGDTYVMGDFEDITDLGPSAAIYIHRDGVVESFPLPHNRRRWVIRTSQRYDNGDPQQLRDVITDSVKQRCTHDLTSTPHFMLSAFGVEHYLAKTFATDRMVLAGDAAHITSPIGGQGLNLGWHDAFWLSQALATAVANPLEASSALEHYASRCQHAAYRAIKRAEFYMWVGRPRKHPWVRDLIAHTALKTRAKKTMARMFTMQDIRLK